jgi:hypothetical protein
MIPLDTEISEADLIAYVDRWVTLLEREDYVGAMDLIDRDPTWTPELIRKVIKSYGEESPAQRVTLLAAPTDIKQRKNVDRWDDAPNGSLGEVWYDLGIDGKASDLTATFTIRARDGGLVLRINDLHVM